MTYMPARLRLYDLRISRLPEVIGLCQADVPGIARFVNDAQRRLLMCKEAGDEGWWGTWAEIGFNVSRALPYITLRREIARLQSVNVCDQPIALENQFSEYLQFGNGRLPKQRIGCGAAIRTAYTRNNQPTFVPLSSPPQNIHVFASDAADMDGRHRVLIQALDNNNVPIYSQDGLVQVTGEFVTLESPFVAFPYPVNLILGIQKDVTKGMVQFFQVDPTTGNSILLLTMEPGETTASYRRYYFDSLPSNCCAGADTVRVTAIVKLDLVPVAVDTDYLLIQNPEAIIEECASIRYGMVDTPAAKQMSQERHIQAVRYLIGELTHYLGLDKPAVVFKPFGTANLERVRINMR